MSGETSYRRFNLRIPAELFERLDLIADARSHSMNAEIVQRLEESFEQTPLDKFAQDVSITKWYPLAVEETLKLEVEVVSLREQLAEATEQFEKGRLTAELDVAIRRRDSSRRTIMLIERAARRVAAPMPGYPDALASQPKPGDQ